MRGSSSRRVGRAAVMEGRCRGEASSKLGHGKLANLVLCSCRSLGGYDVLYRVSQG
jgi:hypothetical protein